MVFLLAVDRCRTLKGIGKLKVVGDILGRLATEYVDHDAVTQSLGSVRPSVAQSPPSSTYKEGGTEQHSHYGRHHEEDKGERDKLLLPRLRRRWAVRRSCVDDRGRALGALIRTHYDER
jgi:hypothetical protein